MFVCCACMSGGVRGIVSGVGGQGIEGEEFVCECEKFKF